MSQKRILVVDDSGSLRRIIKNYLEQGFPEAIFYSAENGDLAERLIQEQAVYGEPIDVVILDWMMPDVSGYEFLKRIRSVAAFSKLPKVIMLTAETDPTQVEACLKYNIEAYLTKPFSQQQIIDAVKHVLAGEEMKNAV
ncbi:response regulator [Bdellovibrionota bacterium FG-2]